MRIIRSPNRRYRLSRPLLRATRSADVSIPATPTYGHWVEIQADTLAGGQDLADMEAALDASANIVGAHRRWYWKDVEPTAGSYVWADIDAHLAACASRGKKLVVFLMDKGFAYDSGHPLPADMSIGGANEIEFEYVTGAYGPARWHSIWAPRMINILTRIYQRYNGHPAFEGVALQETTLGSPWTTPVTVNGELYNHDTHVQNFIDVFTDTAQYRSRSWLLWYGTWFGPPATEVAAMATIRAACVPARDRLCIGITNSRLWDHEDPSGATGWPNSLKNRILDTTIMSDWAAAGFPTFAAHQADDFKYSTGSETDPQRDMLYNYERITRDTATRGPGGDPGFADWCSAVKAFVWNYQKTAVGSTFKHQYDAGVADNTVFDAVSIVNTEPRWWETPAPFALNTFAFPGATYVQYESVSPDPALAADGDELTLAIWVNMLGSTNGTLYNLLSLETSASSARFKLVRNTGNKIAFQAKNTAGVDALASGTVKSSTSLLDTSGPKLVMISARRTTPIVQMYFGDTSEYPSNAWADSSAAFSFADTRKATLGASWTGGNPMLAQVGGVYFANWYMDLSQEKVRRALITAIGKPVFAGHQGRRYDAGDGGYNSSYRRPLIYIGNPDSATEINAGGAINRGSWEPTGSWTKTGDTIEEGAPL